MADRTPPAGKRRRSPLFEKPGRMDEIPVAEQAKTVVSQILALLRCVFALENDPAADLPVAQLRVCDMLHRGPRSMSAISRELGVSLSATTQLADRLERARLVRRVPEGSDRRVRCLELTPHGAKIMRCREETRLDRASAVLEHLPAQTRLEVLAALDMLVGAAADVKDQSRLVENIGQ
jgi:DNA-binding MarR family transcriptional regulator